MIEQVKELDPEFGAKPLLELEALEHREIHVLEGRVPEDVPAHGAKSSIHGGSHHRVALYEAARSLKCAGVGGDRRALRTERRREGSHYAGNPGCGGARSCSYVSERHYSCSRSVWERAERNGTRTGLEDR